MSRETITISNGKNIRAWIAIVLAVGGIFTAGIGGWVSLKRDVEKNCTNVHAAMKTQRELQNIIRKNQLDMIQMKSDVSWIKRGIERINYKLDKAFYSPLQISDEMH